MSQYPGQYAQGPPGGYGQPNPGMPPNSMHNGQPLPGGGQFGGLMKPVVQNGPPAGPPGGFAGPQGDILGASRPGGPMPFPNRGPVPQGQMGAPRPMNPNLGPAPGTNQMTSQMGNMSISGPPRPPGPGQMGGIPIRGPGPGMMSPMGGSSSVSGPPSSMGAPPASMIGSPLMGGTQSSMGGPPSSMGGPPSSIGGPGNFRPPGNVGAPPGNFGTPPGSMAGPPSSMGGPTIGFGASPSSMGGPTTGFGAPPSTMGGPPSSLGGPQGSFSSPSSGYSHPGVSQGPPGAFTPPVLGQGFAPPSTMASGIRPPMAGPPMMGGPPGQMGMDRQTPTSLAGQPPNMSASMGGYGPPQPGQHTPGFQPVSSQGFQPMPPHAPVAGYPGAPPQQYNQPGYSAGMSGPTTGMQPGMQSSLQPPAQKKLDPDQMPSPIQVIEDDKRNRSGVFSSGGKGQVPPLVTTQFITQDQGNCNPVFMRSTMYNVPCTSDMLKNSHIPFSLSVSPFAKLQPEENPPPIVNLGELGPVRCKRCKAYMNPNMMFIDGGRRFQCVFCGAATDVPDQYFAHLDHTGRRIDSYDRPELCLGSYEFVATKDYCKNGTLPNAPAFIFMIDVSYNAVKCGLVNLICERLKKDILVNLPRETGAEESEIHVGFVTYSKEIHFYNVKGTLAQPQMLVVSDLADVFVPLLDGFLVKLSESEAVIDSLLSQIPQMFVDSRETEVVLGPVIQASLDALKSADRSGKLYIFHTSLPIGEAPGKLANRDDRKLLGTDKEKTILSPQCKFYSQLGTDCVAVGCSVDIFFFPNSYCDVATISDICRLTSGNLYKYSYFQADLDGDRFMEDLKNNVQSQRAFDAIVRIRTSQGIRPVDFLGNFYMSNTTDVEMCAIDSNQALAVEIKHDDKLSEQDGAYIQVATLFTSVSGQRRLRVHNQALNCCSQLADLFRNCELDTLVNYMSKLAIRNILNKSPRETREHIMNEVAQILACYRKNCASPSSAGQLILPECMKLLPLYGNCVIKNDGIQGGQEISTDDRSYLMHLINSMDVKSSCAFFYPRLIPLHTLEPTGTDMPTALRCSAERLQDNGVYLLENGVSMFMWIGHKVDPDWIQKMFGVQSAAQIDIDKFRLLELENDVSHRVRQVVQMVRAQRNRYMKLTIVRQRDELERWFNHFLVEDKSQNGSSSYVDFLCHIHKEIRTLLS